MKKIKLVGLVGIFALSLACTTNAAAETAGTESENTQTSETTSSEGTTEETTGDSSIDTTPEAAIQPLDEADKKESSELTKEAAEDTKQYVELDLSAEPAAHFEERDKVSPYDFQALLERFSKLKLTNLRFDGPEYYMADKTGTFPVKVIAEANDGKTYLITCTYFVQSKEATLSDPVLSYDSQTHTLNGKTLANHEIRFFKVGLLEGETSPDEIPAPPSVTADENGNFSISANVFERNRLMVAVAYSPDGTTFSKGVQFKIPLEATEDSDSEQQKPESTTATTAPAKPVGAKNSLPKTGEESSPVLKTSGMLAILGALGMFFVKKKKEETN